ncbi:class I SAM-dependent methyltransferase [Candidatus Nomurabacteria bacterium]|nr:class I SAM-dependent methyltransferase [Candidatus Nomurabacteria bacterium]
MIKEIKIFTAKNWSASSDYEMLDTGEREKIERFGSRIFVRPYEDAVWGKTLSVKDWDKNDGKFYSSKGGSKAGWRMDKKINEKFEMSYNGLKFWAMPTPFRHLGFFPEQASHWDFIEEKIRGAKKPVKFLNLFGYTGVASLFALRAGADITHVDASKSSLSWAKDNQNLAGMSNMPMKIILEDVMKFLEREIKRGNKYDAVIMDPPKFGRGPKGETWKIEENLPKLLNNVKRVLSDNPLFVILNSYSIDASALSLGYALENAMIEMKGEVSCGELCLKEKSKDRNIPLSNTAIWEIK